MDTMQPIPSESNGSPVPTAGGPASARAVLWGAVALLTLLVLLASLMSQRPDISLGGPGVRLMLRLPDPLVYGLMGLLVLSAITIFAVLFPREVRLWRRKNPDEFEEYKEPPKVSFGVMVVLLLALLMPIGLMVYLYWGAWQPLHAVKGFQPEARLGRVQPPPRVFDTEKPASEAPGYTWALFVLAALAGLGVLGGGAWVLFGERIERWWYGIPIEGEARRALLEAVEISLDDLLREPDPRRAVIACYRRLEDVLAQHGLRRAPWQTPLEYFHAALQRFHLPADRLRGLTVLFELAKFSAHRLGLAEKELAIGALREVKTALEEKSHVPTA